MPSSLSHVGAALLLLLVGASAAAPALASQATACDAEPLASTGSCAAGGDHALLQRKVRHDRSLDVEQGEGPVIQSGDTIFLTAFTGNQLTLQDGRLNAQFHDHGAWQSFVIEKDGGGPILGGDKVYFRGHTGNYITVEDRLVQAFWENQRGEWQQLEVEKFEGEGQSLHSGDQITLRAHTGKRITVMPETGEVDAEAEVHASWDHRGEWQTLTIEKRAQDRACSGAYEQCGGMHWQGPTCCVEGFECHDQNDYHSICNPVSDASTTHPPRTTPATPATTRPATTPATPATTRPATTATTTAAPTTTAGTTSAATTSATTTAPPSTTASTTALPQTTPSPSPPPVDNSWTRGTWTTGYWDCCKPSCSWPGKGNVDQPVKACTAGTGFPLEDINEGSVCDGGRAASCANNAPWAISSNLSFGFAAAAVSGNHGLTGDDNCGQCYELRFVGGRHRNGNWGGSHPRLEGKTMVVQVTNIGYDVTGAHSFDLQIPGAGQGAFSNGCTAQFDGFVSGDFDCDNLYGGCNERVGCDRLPLDLQAGCNWRYDWYYWLAQGGQSNNPFVDFRRVKCPMEIIAVTGSTPNDDDDFPTVHPASYGPLY